jgi:hypothetical protein
MYKLYSYASAREASAIVTSKKGLYVQPQTYTDCTRDCEVEKILFYFILKWQNILTV